MKFTSFVGIDISKSDFDVAILNNQGITIGNQKFPNSTSGFKRLTHWINKHDQAGTTVVCLEHTGVYCLPICIFFEESGIKYTLQPGLQIKRSMGIQRGKNDKADAQMIAKYAYLNRNEIKCYTLPSSTLMKLKQLISYRERLIKSKVAIKTASKELQFLNDKKLHRLVINDSEAHVESLTKSIAQVDKELKELVKTDPELKRLFDLATSVKGVGLQIAVNMLITTHGFTKFSSWRKFSCYCGIAPFEYRSGSSIRGKTKVSHLGNKRMKAIIGNGIASAIQNDPEIAKYYKRKLEEGKHKMVVLNAIKNKLISRVFAVIKRGTPFVPLYQHY